MLGGIRPATPEEAVHMEKHVRGYTGLDFNTQVALQSVKYIEDRRIAYYGRSSKYTVR